jgi:hypothetical protein
VNGSSNSRSAVKSVHPCEVVQAGIDTWSIAWRVDRDGPAARALEALATVPVARGRVIEESIAGHRVGWFPSACLAFAEGHPGGDRLGRADELHAVAKALQDAICDRGVPLPRQLAAWDRAGSTGFVGVRRLDVTADLRFRSAGEGWAVLAGVAAMQLPRMKSATWRSARGQLETVAFYGHSGRKMLARMYDAGVRHGTAPPGFLLRPEDQRRWPSGHRRTLDELSPAYVREKWRGRFLPLWKATKGVTVGTPDAIAAKLDALVNEGAITNEMADKLAGYSIRSRAGLWSGNARTGRRRRADLRRCGLVLADDVMQEVEIDLHEVLEAAIEAEAWGCDG